MNRVAVLVLGLLAALLFYHCLSSRPEAIQAEVSACVRESMAGAELGGVTVAVDGRDVTLAGIAESDSARERAVVLASGDCGARAVIDTLVVAPPEPYRLSLCIDRDGVTAEGFVPDAETRTRYLDAARARLGNVALDANLEVRGDPPAGFDRLIRTAFRELSQMDEGCIELERTQVSVSGRLRSENARAIVTDELDAAAASDFTVSYDLAVPRLSDEAAACQEALDVLLAPGEQVLFDFDSSEIHAEGRALLEEAEAIWETCPGLSLIVAGHTDAEGEAEYNRSLSERRANAVVDYLVGQGFDPDRLTPIGFGESQPQAPNDTEEGRAQNRRMEFRVRENLE